MTRPVPRIFGNKTVRIGAASRQRIGSPVVVRSLRLGELRSPRRPPSFLIARRTLSREERNREQVDVGPTDPLTMPADCRLRRIRRAAAKRSPRLGGQRVGVGAGIDR